MKIPALSPSKTGAAIVVQTETPPIQKPVESKPINQAQASTPETLPKSGLLKSTGLKTLKALKWTLRNLHNIIVYGTVAGTAAAFTPVAWKGWNEIMQGTGYVPRPSLEKSIIEERHQYPYDNFIQNFDSFKSIHEAITIANINPYSLDLNGSGFILDTKEEINELITRLEVAKRNSSSYTNEFETAILDLRNINYLSQLIWGKDGPKADNILQMGEPTCQGASALRGLFLTEESIQATKGSVRITSYDLTPGESFHINTSIRINGADVEIPFAELKTSQSAAGFTPSRSDDGSLFTGIFSLGLKKSSPDSIPNFWPSSSPILLTGKNYSTVPIVIFSDNELDDILSSAPSTLMTAAGMFSFDDMKNGLTYRQKDWVSPQYSPEKASDFIAKLAEQSQQIKSGIPDISLKELPSAIKELPKKEPTAPLVASTSFPPSAPLSTSTPPSTERVLSAEHVSTGHVYVVEAYDRDNGILTISDAHRTKIRLTRNEVRERLIALVLPNDNFNGFGSRTLAAYGLLTLAGLSYHFGKKKLKNALLVLRTKSAA